MPDLAEGFSLEQPISTWNRPLKADFRQLFQALAKTAVGGYSGRWDQAAQSAADALSFAGLEGQTPGARAYLLIRRALTRALFDLAHSVSTRFDLGRDDFEPVADAVDLAFEETPLAVGRQFFDHPRQLPLIHTIRQPFTEFLVSLGVSQIEAEQTARRLDSYFVLALHDEWQRRPEDYRAVLDALEGSPFATADERERRWRQYAAWLEQQLDEPVFDEAFGLRQIYIPLRAYWEEKRKGRDGDFEPREVPPRGGEVSRHVVAVEEELAAWVDAADRDDAARVISGGPGSGKSTLGRVFAATMARRTDLRVVLVPLHHFDPGADLVRALAEFAQRDPSLPDGLLTPGSNERLLVIFDGLDELALQGKRSHEVALAVWHGDGRKTSARAIRERCERSRLDRYLDRFEKGAESGITRLLTAFYFRQSGHAHDGEKTFELTHRSFGEYLAARRIVREVALIEKSLALTEDDPDQGIDETQALERWAQTCGPATLDHDLNRFLRAEVALHGLETCLRWQKVTIRLIEHLLRHDRPMTRLDLPSYREMKRQARNAEEALLAVHSACAWVTLQVLDLEWPSPTTAGTWIQEMRGQRESASLIVALTCLNRLDLRGMRLESLNLCDANLSHSNLETASLHAAYLDGATLTWDQCANVLLAHLR